jgi:hypothetical protein
VSIVKLLVSRSKEFLAQLNKHDLCIQLLISTSISFSTKASTLLDGVLVCGNTNKCDLSKRFQKLTVLLANSDIGV